MKELTIEAPAKINLTLDILRKRPDGYHDLRMVMQTISLCDTVKIRTGTGSGTIRLECSRPDLPSGNENIAVRAAECFLKETGCFNDGMDLFLEKRIPVCAGMAGGSTDGAAVLCALRRLLCPEMPAAELEKMGAKVGSDVPFCIRGGTALAEGRGELLTDWPSMPECFLVICKPDFGISTPELYRRVQVENLHKHPRTEAMHAALTAGSLTRTAAEVCNVFEEVLTAEKPEIDRIKRALLQEGAMAAAMTGSGPTVFGIFEQKRDAESAAEALHSLAYRQVFVTKPLNRV